jgi:predicted nucleic acid-binding protein
VLVLDTSALLAALVAQPPSAKLVERLGADGDLHAPHLIDVEALQALRRLVHRGYLSPERAEAAREDLRDLAIVRYPHVELLDRMWALRRHLTAYDAVFVALSEVLDAPLVTVDARLGAIGGHGATIETY